MVLFLLDANLSPIVSRFLVQLLRLDGFSLQGRGLGQLPDHEVIRMARSMGRVMPPLEPPTVLVRLAAGIGRK